MPYSKNGGRPDWAEPDIQQAIGRAFSRHAGLDLYDLSVDAHDGTVILLGTVPCWSEHDEAVATAWSAPGVTHVDDRIAVAY